MLNVEITIFTPRCTALEIMFCVIFVLNHSHYIHYIYVTHASRYAHAHMYTSKSSRSLGKDICIHLFTNQTFFESTLWVHQIINRIIWYTYCMYLSLIYMKRRWLYKSSGCDEGPRIRWLRDATG